MNEYKYVARVGEGLERREDRVLNLDCMAWLHKRG